MKSKQKQDSFKEPATTRSCFLLRFSCPKYTKALYSWQYLFSKKKLNRPDGRFKKAISMI